MTELLACDAFLAAADPESAVVDGDHCRYGELRERVAAIASALRAEVPQGSFVLLAMSPSVDSIAAYLAVMRAGLVAVPVGPTSARGSIARILKEAEPQIRIGDFGSLTPRLASVPPWPAGETGQPRPVGWPPPAADSPALVLYTSGTTAAPKGVVLSHRNLAANTASILAAVPLRRNDVVALVLPLHHSYGLSVLHTTLAAGARLAPVDFSIPADAVGRLAAVGATVLPGVPFHFESLLGRVASFDQAALPRLRSAMVAGGAMPVELAETFGARFPAAELHIMYGQTEATARLSSLPPAELRTRPGSIGRGIPGVELSVLDRSGTEAAPGEVGEVYARGDNVMRGYLGDEAASVEVLTPHGLRTRDLGWVDEDGYVYLAGRRGDFVKVRGHRISLPAVEAQIESCPDVLEAVARGVQGEAGGEVIVAEVAMNPSSPEAALADLRAHLRTLLKPVERPAAISLVESVPRTASGKKIRWRK
ncbi:MAG: putative fatty-acid--CoA ligase [Solirubrobacterales bacterium]|nr:putative fatty-acid--CoA ligase [Solirubrobacterales bacterium]